MLRNDLVSKAPPLPPLPKNSETTNLYYSAPACTFGYIPNFFASPGNLTSQPKQAAATVPVEQVGIAISGWAIDPGTGQPAKTVVAVSDGKVVATAATGGSRPDVAAGISDPAAIDSGFTIDVPASVRGPVALYALDANGSASELAREQSVPSKISAVSGSSSVKTADGVVHPVIAGTSAGYSDSYQHQDTQITRLKFPSGTNLSSFQWLEVKSASSLGNGSFVLTDNPNAPVGHDITFQTLPRVGGHVFVEVGSCIQWHGYAGSTSLYLVRTGSALKEPVRLSLYR